MIGWQVRAALFAGAIAAILFGVYQVYSAGWRDGRNALIAEQARIVADKLKGAADADEASRACAANPDCRMRNDGFRRD